MAPDDQPMFRFEASCGADAARLAGKVRLEGLIDGREHRFLAFRHPETGTWRAAYWTVRADGGMFGEPVYVDCLQPAVLRKNAAEFWQAVAAACTAYDAAQAANRTQAGS